MSYGLLPANVRHDKSIGDKAKLLYAEITAATDSKGFCTETNDRLGERMGATTRTIARALNELLKAGHVTKTFTPNRLRQLSANALAGVVFARPEEEKKVLPKEEPVSQTFETLIRYWETSFNLSLPKEKIKQCYKLYQERKKTFNDLDLIKALQARITYLAQSEYHNRPENVGVFGEPDIVLATDKSVSQWIKLA